MQKLYRLAALLAVIALVLTACVAPGAAPAASGGAAPIGARNRCWPYLGDKSEPRQRLTRMGASREAGIAIA